MGVFKQFATNRKLEIDGVPVKFNANPDGTIPTIYVRRTHIGSQRHQAIFERVTRPYKHLIDDKSIDEALDVKLMQQVLAESCITGWENFRLPIGIAGGKGEGGENKDNPQDFYNMEFSTQAVVEVFAALPDLWRECGRVSTDPDSYKEGDLEAIAKN